ncbi:hypothetical protein HDV00_011741 [Rhizophlyctis rosea]|nr:hypothetical protein HDV00_011741 [Rhizophlyctis rosea]
MEAVTTAPMTIMTVGRLMRVDVVAVMAVAGDMTGRLMGTMVREVAGVDMMRRIAEEVMIGGTEVEGMAVTEVAVDMAAGLRPLEGATRGTEEERNRSTCLYVGNLPYTFRDDDVKDLFDRCGRLANVKVPFDRYTGRNKGFAFVTYEERRDAEDAKVKYDGFTIEGRRLKLDWDVGQEKKDEIKGIDRRPRDGGDVPPPPPPGDLSRERGRSPVAGAGGGARRSPQYSPYRRTSPGPYAPRR